MLPLCVCYHFVYVVREAVDVERFFICESLPCDLIGMNSRLMSQYIESVADMWLTALEVPRIYSSVNPFDWMELISVQGKTNFFEKRVGEYQKAGCTVARADQRFDLNEEF